MANRITDLAQRLNGGASLAGLYVSNPDAAVHVYWVGSIPASVTDLASSASDVHVYLHPAAYTQNEMQTAVRKVAGYSDRSVLVVEAGPCVDGSGIRIALADAKTDHPTGDVPAGFQTSLQQLVGTMPVTIDTDVPRGPWPDHALATWDLSRSEHVGTATTRFTALVTRAGCNGGVTGKVDPPQMTVTADRIVISFTVTPGPPRAASCPGNRPVPYVVTLPEPLGSRTLVDGACQTADGISRTSLCADDGIRRRA